MKPFIIFKINQTQHIKAGTGFWGFGVFKLKIKNFEKSQYFKNYENIQDGIQYYFPKILRINPLCLMPPSKKLIVIRMLDKSFYSK